MFSLLKMVSVNYYSHCPIFSSPAHNNIISHLQETRKKKVLFYDTLKHVTWNFNPGLQSVRQTEPCSHVFHFSLRSQDLKDEIQKQNSTIALNLTHARLGKGRRGWWAPSETTGKAERKWCVYQAESESPPANSPHDPAWCHRHPLPITRLSDHPVIVLKLNKETGQD